MSENKTHTYDADSRIGVVGLLLSAQSLDDVIQGVMFPAKQDVACTDISARSDVSDQFTLQPTRSAVVLHDARSTVVIVTLARNVHGQAKILRKRHNGVIWPLLRTICVCR